MKRNLLAIILASQLACHDEPHLEFKDITYEGKDYECLIWSEYKVQIGIKPNASNNIVIVYEQSRELGFFYLREVSSLRTLDTYTLEQGLEMVKLCQEEK